MTITAILSIFQYNNKLAIGRDNNLLVNISEDLKRFKKLTQYSIVVMGRKTWDSLPKKPLENRINIVLSKSNINSKPLLFKEELEYSNVYFTTFEWFVDFYKSYSCNVFVIGGSKIYDLFQEKLQPHYIYFTEIFNYKGIEPNVFIKKPSEKYRLHKYSKKYTDDKSGCEYRYLEYTYDINRKSDEYNYLDLCKKILKQGNNRPDRTGVGTISLFGVQLHFDIESSIPLLTTKRVAWKHCIQELLWFLRGDTDAKILQKQGVKIWDGNTSRKFLDSRNLQNYEEGILGPGYGWCWRFFGAEYDQKNSDTNSKHFNHPGGFDQIKYVIEELKKNPYSRRIMVSAWNPSQMDEIALMPCHYSFQFYVESVILENGELEKYLSCHFIMRSNDLGCGLSFNLLSYTVLTYIIALKCGMKPKKLIYTCSDAHIYSNHIEAINLQLLRKPTVSPVLYVKEDVKDKDFNEISLEDFDIIGYFPDKGIRMEMCV